MSSSSRTVWIIKSLRTEWAEVKTCMEETIYEKYFACRNPSHSAPQSYAGST
jgi:hypothetical protein